MNGFDWHKKESYTFNNRNQLQYKINELSNTYKTNIILVNLPFAEDTNNYNYTVEAWYNFNSRSWIINAYKVELDE